MVGHGHRQHGLAHDSRWTIGSGCGKEQLAKTGPPRLPVVSDASSDLVEVYGPGACYCRRFLIEAPLRTTTRHKTLKGQERGESPQCTLQLFEGLTLVDETDADREQVGRSVIPRGLNEAVGRLPL